MTCIRTTQHNTSHTTRTHTHTTLGSFWDFTRDCNDEFILYGGVTVLNEVFFFFARWTARATAVLVLVLVQLLEIDNLVRRKYEYSYRTVSEYGRSSLLGTCGQWLGAVTCAVYLPPGRTVPLHFHSLVRRHFARFVASPPPKTVRNCTPLRGVVKAERRARRRGLNPRFPNVRSLSISGFRRSDVAAPHRPDLRGAALARREAGGATNPAGRSSAPHRQAESGGQGLEPDAICRSNLPQQLYYSLVSESP